MPPKRIDCDEGVTTRLTTSRSAKSVPPLESPVAVIRTVPAAIPVTRPVVVLTVATDGLFVDHVKVESPGSFELAESASVEPC